MFHGRQINDKINELHERALSHHLKNCWLKVKLLHENIRSLAIETYKAINNLPGGNLSEFFVRNDLSYNLGRTNSSKYQ